MVRCLIVTTLFGVAIAVAGCNGQSSGNVISGAVTYQGSPLPRGTILLQPDSSQGNSGPAITADVVDGRYDTSDSKTGVRPGAYKVRITGFDGVANPDAELPLGKPLFFDYKTTVDLPDEDSDGIDFEIPGK